MIPFTAAIGLLFALLILELVSAFTGFSLMSSDGDGLDLDIDADAGVDFDLDADIDLDVPEFEMGDIDAADLDVGCADGAQGLSLLAWLGIGQVPTAIWGASALAAFGLSGTALQSVTQTLTGGMIPAAIAIPLAVPPTVLFAKALSVRLARAIPKTETAAVTKRSFAGNHGTITQGTARRGSPAEVRMRDWHGNLHHLRLEPYDDAAALPKGTDVYVTRTADGTLRLMPLTDD